MAAHALLMRVTRRSVLEAWAWQSPSDMDCDATVRVARKLAVIASSR